MSLFRIINKFFSFLYFLLLHKNAKLAFLFAHNNVSFQAAKTVSRKGNSIESRETGNKVAIASIGRFKVGITILLKLLNAPNIKVTDLQANGFTILANETAVIHIETMDNLFTVFEIYIENFYGLALPGSKNVVIDIGMNVGIASLYLASLDTVQKVYSYEPFTQTYNDALQNFAKNPAQQQKIEAFNYGISSYSGVMKVPMLTGGSAVASTNELFIQHHHKAADGFVEVQLRNINEVIEEIASANPQSDIYLKIDCEGEEYAIIDALHSSGQFSKNIKGFLIEWHIKGATPLCNTLSENGFTSLDLPIVSLSTFQQPEAGMLYAFR